MWEVDAYLKELSRAEKKDTRVVDNLVDIQGWYFVVHVCIVTVSLNYRRVYLINWQHF
jgi:hypothetical protein